MQDDPGYRVQLHLVFGFLIFLSVLTIQAILGSSLHEISSARAWIFPLVLVFVSGISYLPFHRHLRDQKSATLAVTPTKIGLVIVGIFLLTAEDNSFIPVMVVATSFLLLLLALPAWILITLGVFTTKQLASRLCPADQGSDSESGQQSSNGQTHSLAEKP